MKLEILTSDEIIPAIRKEVCRMADAGEIKIEMEFSIADDPDLLRLQARIAALEKLLTKQTTAKTAEPKTVKPMSPKRFNPLA